MGTLNGVVSDACARARLGCAPGAEVALDVLELGTLTPSSEGPFPLRLVRKGSRFVGLVNSRGAVFHCYTAVLPVWGYLRQNVSPSLSSIDPSARPSSTSALGTHTTALSFPATSRYLVPTVALSHTDSLVWVLYSERSEAFTARSRWSLNRNRWWI